MRHQRSFVKNNGFGSKIQTTLCDKVSNSDHCARNIVTKNGKIDTPQMALELKSPVKFARCLILTIMCAPHATELSQLANGEGTAALSKVHKIRLAAQPLGLRGSPARRRKRRRRESRRRPRSSPLFRGRDPPWSCTTDTGSSASAPTCANLAADSHEFHQKKCTSLCVGER